MAAAGFGWDATHCVRVCLYGVLVYVVRRMCILCVCVLGSASRLAGVVNGRGDDWSVRAGGARPLFIPFPSSCISLAMSCCQLLVLSLLSSLRCVSDQRL